MNVYDFDNTIYSGESTFDFFLYCLIRRPALVKYIRKFVVNLVKYKMCMISREKLHELICENMAGLVKACPDFEKLSEKFWDKNIDKIKAFYINCRKDDDVIISASFDFLLQPVCTRLGIKHLICSEADIVNGSVIRLCYRENKPELFDEVFPGAVIENFYTDSKNDLPMMRRAERSYFVKGENVTEYAPA